MRNTQQLSDLHPMVVYLHLIFLCQAVKIKMTNLLGGPIMEDQYGSDFMTIMDEDGTEYELEVLHTLEYNGITYLAVIPAGDEESSDLEVSILKSEEDEDGEPLLCAIEDEEELRSVYDLIMETLYSEDDE